MHDKVVSRDKHQALEYIQSMLRELREKAAGDRQDMLAFLIEMAYVEASDRLRELHSWKRDGGT